MKISQLPPTAHSLARAHGVRGASPVTDTQPELELSPAAPASTAAANPAVETRRPDAPPGLEKVLARLQAMTDRTSGQSNALSRIEANLARYAEMRAMEPPPPSSSETPAPTPDAAPATDPSAPPEAATVPVVTTETPGVDPAVPPVV